MNNEFDSTRAVLEATLQYCNALIEHGADVQGDAHNLVVLQYNAMIEAVKGQPHKLVNVRDQVQAALNARV